MIGSTMGNVCGIATPPKQISQTENQLNIVNYNVKMLHGSISLLSEKLKPILRSQSPATVGECMKEPVELVPIAENFKKLGSDIMFANSQIRDLLERIEI